MLQSEYLVLFSIYVQTSALIQPSASLLIFYDIGYRPHSPLRPTGPISTAQTMYDKERGEKTIATAATEGALVIFNNI